MRLYLHCVHSTSTQAPSTASDEYSSSPDVPLWLYIVIGLTPAAAVAGFIGVLYARHHWQHAILPDVAERQRNLQFALLDINPLHQTQVPLVLHTAPPPYSVSERVPELASHEESLLYKTNAFLNLKL
jgi:hypothetical protein